MMDTYMFWCMMLGSFKRGEVTGTEDPQKNIPNCATAPREGDRRIYSKNPHQHPRQQLAAGPTYCSICGVFQPPGTCIMHLGDYPLMT